MKKFIFTILMSTIFGLLLISCSPEITDTVSVTSPTQQGTLRLYPSDTPSPSPYPENFASPTPSPTITPTVEPVYYTVRENDDMFGISLWYGISLEALQTANPTVNPLFMSVGTVLLIPVTPQAATPMPALQTSPTAQSLLSRVYEPVCYSDSTGGLTCFILVENDTKNNLENVGGTLTLKPSGNSNEIRVSGIMPVNILPAGSRLPIVTYIPGPIPDDFSVSFIVDVVFPVAKDDARYIDTSIKDVDFAYSSGKKIATITGEISLIDSRQLAQRVWILAVGYDGSGNVVGIRRWEAQKSLSPRDAQNFSFTLYSLGPTIETIELFAEAQP